MELIKIDGNRLKVMLSAEDLREYELDCDALEEGEVNAKGAFDGILDEARTRCGFDSESGSLLVKVYPSRSGGCELFVTLVDSSSEQEMTGVKIARRKCTYRTQNMSDLLRLLHQLKQSGYRGRAEAYADLERSGYFICFDREAPLAGEFGKRVKNASAELYLAEHCKLISRDAVNALGGLM